MSIATETETVIKRILPYLQRRGYDIATDCGYEQGTVLQERYAKGYIDILVTAGKQRPQFLIEAKRLHKKLTAKDKKQALEYGRAHRVPFVVLTNGTEIQCFNTTTGNAIRWDGKLTRKIPTKSQLVRVMTYLRANKTADDVPLGSDSSLPFRPGLPLRQLNELFKRCHNRIRKIEKNEEHVFNDFSKLLFLKLIEEKADAGDLTLPYSYRFFELAEKSPSEADQVKDAITRMLEDIRNRTPYGEVLRDNLYLRNPRTFLHLVKELAAVSFADSSVDSKGAAFEYYVRATLKGKRLGQYFTPRPLVELMNALVGDEKILNGIRSGESIKVLDPACGTGGFLVHLMQDNIRRIDRLLADGKISKRVRDSLVKKVQADTFFGGDANESVAAAAKMNMVIAGDGHTNIVCEDSLTASSSIWNVEEPGYDFILTNPPFGTSEADSLSSDDLGQYPVRTTKGQLLFLQKMVLSTIPGGQICTVIDEGMLNTATAADVRKWLLQQCRVRAVISLPEETFKPNKINVSSSVLYLERREEPNEDLDDEYEIPFVRLESLGYQGSGEQIRGFLLDRLLDEAATSMLDSSKGSPRCGYSWRAFDVSSSLIGADPTYRLDVRYWEPEVRAVIESLRAKPSTKTIEDINKIVTRRGKSPPVAAYVGPEDGYALVVKAGSNISRHGRLIEDGDFIEKDVYDSMGAFHLQDGDILLASSGTGTLGKCCVYRSDRPAIADGHVTVIRVDQEEICPEYLADYLRAGNGAPQIQRLFTGSTGIIELAPDQVKTVLVEIPSLSDQVSASKELREAEDQYSITIGEANEGLSKAYEEFAAL